jgi:hypothetical protein
MFWISKTTSPQTQRRREPLSEYFLRPSQNQTSHDSLSLEPIREIVAVSLSARQIQFICLHLNRDDQGSASEGSPFAIDDSSSRGSASFVIGVSSWSATARADVPLTISDSKVTSMMFLGFLTSHHPPPAISVWVRRESVRGARGARVCQSGDVDIRLFG